VETKHSLSSSTFQLAYIGEQKKQSVKFHIRIQRLYMWKGALLRPFKEFYIVLDRLQGLDVTNISLFIAVSQTIFHKNQTLVYPF